MKWEEIEYFLTKYAPFWGVLDVGCGNGRFFWELKNQENSFGNYLWIDTSEKLLEEAHKLYPVIPAHAGIYEKDKPLFLKDSETTLEWYQGTKFSFQLLDMRNLSQLANHSFDNIFFIASFHHLEYIEERIQVLQNTKNILKTWGKVFLTNWALESDFNQSKYSQSKIPWSENEFWGTDFQIKIGEFQRYYHSFTLDELEYFSKKAWFQMIENRLFDTEKNFITILQK
jgi:SAM-dependent methyltransferase